MAAHRNHWLAPEIRNKMATLIKVMVNFFKMTCDHRQRPYFPNNDHRTVEEN
ncbi:hypothetical protein SAMN04515647_3784 [Cohaesibacter sp. ES.047]|nr:hypothetical protein SAMN04515647_3784 [Cohaesibacter sp. ES.047]